MIFAADHCFSIRGQGTVMTGTMIQGSVAVNDVRMAYIILSSIITIFVFIFIICKMSCVFFQTIEIPSMKVIKKVKSIQMFKKPINKIMQVPNNIPIYIYRHHILYLYTVLLWFTGRQSWYMCHSVWPKASWAWLGLHPIHPSDNWCSYRLCPPYILLPWKYTHKSKVPCFYDARDCHGSCLIFWLLWWWFKRRFWF